MNEKRREEFVLLTFAMSIAEGWRSHVAEADRALAAAVYEHVALVRVALRSRDHLCQLLHIGRLNIYNVWEREAVKESYANKDQYWIIKSEAKTEAVLTEKTENGYIHLTGYQKHWLCQNSDVCLCRYTHTHAHSLLYT